MCHLVFEDSSHIKKEKNKEFTSMDFRGVYSFDTIHPLICACVNLICASKIRKIWQNLIEGLLLPSKALMILSLQTICIMACSVTSHDLLWSLLINFYRPTLKRLLLDSIIQLNLDDLVWVIHLGLVFLESCLGLLTQWWSNQFENTLASNWLCKGFQRGL